MRDNPNRFGGGPGTRGKDLLATLELTWEEAQAGGRFHVTIAGEHIGVLVPPGARHEQQIDIARGGEPGENGGIPGDLLVTLNVGPAPARGEDISLTLDLTWREAQAGGITTVAIGNHSEQVVFPAGVTSGWQTRLHGRGGVGAHGGPPGDAVVTVRVLPPPERGTDIQAQLTLTPAQARIGGMHIISTNRPQTSITIPPGTANGQVLRLEGLGQPGINGGPPGDLVLTLRHRSSSRGCVAGGVIGIVVVVFLLFLLGRNPTPPKPKAPPKPINYAAAQLWKTLPSQSGTLLTPAVTSLTFLSNGTLVVGYDAFLFSSMGDVQVWDLPTAKSSQPGDLAKLNGGNANALAASSGNDYLLVGGEFSLTHTFHLYNLAAGNEVSNSAGDFNPPISCMAFAPTESTFAVGCAKESDLPGAFLSPGVQAAQKSRSAKISNNFSLWNVTALGCAKQLQTTGPEVWSVAFSSDGQTLALCHSSEIDQYSAPFQIAGLTTKRPAISLPSVTSFLQAILGPDRAFDHIAYSPDVEGKYLVAAIRSVMTTRSGTTSAPPVTSADVVNEYDAQSGKLIGDFFDQTAVFGRVDGVAFSPDGRAVAICGTGSDGTSGMVTLWDSATQKLLATPLTLSHNEVNAVTFSPDGHDLACGCNDGTVQIYQAT